jgi:hypothetical protein
MPIRLTTLPPSVSRNVGALTSRNPVGYLYLTLHHLITSFFLHSNIFLSTLFSQLLKLCSSVG